MLASLRNQFGKSPQTNPFRTVAGKETGSLAFTRPLAFLNGHADGWGSNLDILPQNWVKTLASGTISITDGHPAVLAMVTAATADAVTSMQISKDGGTTAWAAFQLSATDMILLKRRIKISDATNSAILYGLCNVTAANIFGTGGSSGNIGSGVTDFVGFHKPNASTTLRAIVRTASTSTSQTLTGSVMADDTYIDLAVIARNGTQAIEFWVNGALVFTQSTITNLPATSVKMTVIVAVQTPANAAKTLTHLRGFNYQETSA